MQRSIIQNAGQNAERYGLEVRLDFAWLGQTLSRDDRGIIPSSALQTPSEVVL